MRYIFLYSVLLFSPLLFSLTLHAQTTTSVKASLDRARILIGEPITLRLEVDVPENEAIRFFEIDSIPHFEFLNREKIDTANTGRGTVLTQVLHITSFDSGHWAIPAFPLGETLATDTLPVDVGYSDFNRDQPYHDIKPIIDVNPEEEAKQEETPWWWFAAGGAVVLLILVLLFRRKKKPVVAVAAPPVDPYKDAIDQLDKLQKEKPAAKQYYSRLVDIFRIYLEKRAGIHSLQHTTDDLVQQLKDLGLPNDQFEQLAQSLRLSDFVKFAKYVPVGEDDKQAFSSISRTIQYIEQSIPKSPAASTT